MNRAEYLEQKNGQIARWWGVSLEHVQQTLKNRAAFRNARMYRRRSRERTLAKNWRATAHLPQAGKVYAGEGPLHVMMRETGVTPVQFCEIAGISHTVFHKWCSWPLLDWPLRCLRYYLRMRAMEDYLRQRGVNLDQFEPNTSVTRHRQGRYPRKKGQVDVSNIPLGSYSPYDRA